ncbi:uncharacterized protein [Apostichopus japonicus]|uniref:uncharacterized protein n=1 Tax=Stichopus japonicus TaxID=307972 RepID=UPI003AB1DC23
MAETNDNNLREIRTDAKKRLYPYVAPKWAEALRWKPRYKIDLCQTNTPIQKWYLPEIPNSFEIYIKREDMTGGATSGHKIRRLEFNLAEALEKNCDTVITRGTISSNNCRTAAVASKELGFNVHLCMYKAKMKNQRLPFHGNHCIDRLVGAHLHLNPEPTQTNSTKERDELYHSLRIEGYSPYIVSSEEAGDVGLFGYIDCFDEMIKQGVTERFSDFIVTCGTGQTVAAFIIGNYRNGGKLRLHALSVLDDQATLRKAIIDSLKDVAFLREDYPEDDFSSLINIMDESVFPGYTFFTDKHVEFISEVATRTGILLDPAYTGKSAYTMVRMIQTTPDIFRGKKLLFYNTGSVFGLMNETFTRTAIRREPIDEF